MPYLEIGAAGLLHVRREHIPYSQAQATIMYASDLHLTQWAGHIVPQIVQAVEQAAPDVVLLGGDLVDRASGLPHLTSCIRAIQQICPVWAIAGNHDRAFGVEQVRACIESAGGGWLETTALSLRNGAVRIEGKCRPRKSSGFSILCAHEPAIFPCAVGCDYDLVLAGHLHGGQCVLKEYRGHLYPGAYLYNWNGDRFKQMTTVMLVSRGVNDTLPLRWNCPREVVVCTIG